MPVQSLTQKAGRHLPYLPSAHIPTSHIRARSHPSPQFHVLDTFMSLILLNKNFVPTEPSVLANTKGKSMNQQANSEAQLRHKNSAYLNRRTLKQSRKQLGLEQGLEQPPEALKRRMLLPYVRQWGRFRSSAAPTALKHSLEVALKSCGDNLPGCFQYLRCGHIFPVGLERGGEKKQTSMRKESLMQERIIYSEIN